MNNEMMTRGSIYMADLDPIRGSEQGGYRPVVIIQNDAGNRYSPTIIVAAIASKIASKHTLPTHVPLDHANALEKRSVILLEQIRTLDKVRFGNYVGTVDKKMMNRIETALKISLGLEKENYKNL